MLKPTFQENLTVALESPLGPTRVSFAIKTCANDIAALRTAGSSWEQILIAFNDALARRGRKAISADMLRGIYGRYAPSALPGPKSAQMGNGDAQDRSQQEKMLVTERPGVAATQNKSMKGEFGTGLSDTLQDADRKAATLQQLKDIS